MNNDIQIEIVAFNEDSREYEDALALKQIFESHLTKIENRNTVKGKIYILSSVTLFGTKVKDIDIVVCGEFEPRSNLFIKNVRIKTEHITSDSYPNTSATTDSQIHKSDEIANSISNNKTTFKIESVDLYVFDFLFTIETKHIPEEDMRIVGNSFQVRYKSGWSDVTTQSENQKYSLKSFLESRHNNKKIPYICNFIWLRQLDSKQLKSLVGIDDPNMYNNWLPSVFSLNWLFSLVCVQKPCFGERDRYKFWNCSPKECIKIDDIIEDLTKVKLIPSGLSRRKIEKLTSRLLRNQDYAEAIGKKLLVVNGKAGTGKTFKLLSIAFDLVTQNNARVLMLTYNHALVSDIKRLIALVGIPDGVDGRTLAIQTLHKFFYDIIDGFNLFDSRDFINDYDSYLQELHQLLSANVVTKSDLHDLIKKNNDLLNYDYVLIDEGQDWKNEEREIIVSMYGHNNIIVADAGDQMIRSQSRCDWTVGLNRDLYHSKKPETTSLRQTPNLVRFVSILSDKLGIKWDIKPSLELQGGKVIIKIGEYTKDLHERFYNNTIENDGLAYDYLFLLPPSFVRDVNKFSIFNKLGIKIWDGTNRELRNEYSINVDECRVLQYDSCRGLEAWTVVCMEFDKFIEHKQTHYEIGIEESQITIEDELSRRERFSFKWALMPVTRPISNLIITISKADSKISSILLEMAKSEDFIEVIT